MAKANGEIQYVGLKELATWMGRTTRRVLQLVEEGVIPKAGRGRYPLKACMMAYCKHLTDLSEGRGRTSELSQEKLLVARLERRKKELEFAAAEGSVILVKDHEKAMSEAFLLVRSNIRNLPGSVAPRLVGLDDARDIQSVLVPAVDDALRAIITEAERRMEDDTLPDDLPGRKPLIAHGVDSLPKLLDVPDLEQVPGIGPKTALRIDQWIQDATR
jgi:phage terminase Nu1 subunit (DNA packaging protein)